MKEKDVHKRVKESREGRQENLQTRSSNLTPTLVRNIELSQDSEEKRNLIDMLVQDQAGVDFARGKATAVVRDPQVENH